MAVFDEGLPVVLVLGGIQLQPSYTATFLELVDATSHNLHFRTARMSGSAMERRRSRRPISWKYGGGIQIASSFTRSPVGRSEDGRRLGVAYCRAPADRQDEGAGETAAAQRCPERQV